MGRVMAVCISEMRGTRKRNVGRAVLVKDWGIEGDSHAGGWHRAVSLLSHEKIEAFRAKGMPQIEYGDFAENIVVSGVDFARLPVGTRFRCGQAVLRMTQIGKECHSDCEIRRLSGDCIMPREGVFAVVERGGEIAAGDEFGMIPSVAVITVSDSAFAGERRDEAGPAVSAFMEKNGYEVTETHVVSDDRQELARLLAEIADEGRVHLILTSGGTGFSPRDNAPEALTDAAERAVPGIPEAMRAYSMTLTPRAMLSRAAAGIRKRTLIINLPGSPKAAVENVQAVMPALGHGIEILTGSAVNCASTGGQASPSGAVSEKP